MLFGEEALEGDAGGFLLGLFFCVAFGFREGSGAVAEGRLERGTFVADTILAKHDERYMPPELGNLAAEHKAGKTLEK